VTASTKTLDHLLEGIVVAPAIAVRALTVDSRAVRAGDVFVALRGGSRHGLEFAAQAIDRGAAAVLSDEPVDGEWPSIVPLVIVPGLRRSLGLLATRFYGSAEQPLCVIGVTGTNGKTSTVQLLAQALTRAGKVAGTIGTLGFGLHGRLQSGERTTPDVFSVHAALAAMRSAGASHVAMEVSSHALDQQRVDGVDFRIAIFTNLTHDHLDYHATMLAYFEAKARLFRDFTPEAAIIDIDGDWGQRLARGPLTSRRVIRTSGAGDPGADWRAESVVTSPAGLVFDLVSPTGRIGIDSRLLGRFNVSNLVGVAACLGELGLGLDDIAEILAELTPIPGRMTRVDAGAGPLVVVDYAHTPDALMQALTSLRPHTPGALHCVFGCGGDRDAAKRPAMGAIAEALADHVTVTDDNPRSEDGDLIVEAILAGMKSPERAIVQRDRRLAITSAIRSARRDDTVLLAGKGHETYQESNGVRLPFDDAAEAALALGVAA
jgi:UDP-N-acetylmuramoyl-L-alanyl-D-glutamate--2,6-diaminopimelate ligase